MNPTSISNEVIIIIRMGKRMNDLEMELNQWKKKFYQNANRGIVRNARANFPLFPPILAFDCAFWYFHYPWTILFAEKTTAKVK